MDLQRTFTFRNSKQTYTGIPIIAANMDTTGTFEMAQVLSKVSQQPNERIMNTSGGRLGSSQTSAGELGVGFFLLTGG